jgi:hypothetical protein
MTTSCAPPTGTAATPSTGTTASGSGVSARRDPDLLVSGLLGFWKGGAQRWGRSPPSAPAKPVKFFQKRAFLPVRQECAYGQTVPPSVA